MLQWVSSELGRCHSGPSGCASLAEHGDGEKQEEAVFCTPLVSLAGSVAALLYRSSRRSARSSYSHVVEV